MSISIKMISFLRFVLIKLFRIENRKTKNFHASANEKLRFLHKIIIAKMVKKRPFFEMKEWSKNMFFPYILSKSENLGTFCILARHMYQLIQCTQ